MKQLIIMLFLLAGLGINLPAQTKTQETGQYRLIGYQGKDTLSLGIVSLKNKTVTLDLGNYRGAIRLDPVGKEFNDISAHLNAIPLIRSQKAFDAAKAYICDTLPFDVLYNSGMWQEYIQQWVGLDIHTTQNPDQFAAAFVPGAKKILTRTAPIHPEAASLLGKDLIHFFEQYGLDKAAENIASYCLEIQLPDGELQAIASRLQITARLIGNPAPPIPGVDLTSPTLLIFYETGCEHCDAQIKELKEKYNEIQKKGYRVVSISSDVNESIFRKASDGLPWPDKLCDLKGLESENFKQYGVSATPTIYLINEKGVVQGRYASFAETNLINSK